MGVQGSDRLADVIAAVGEFSGRLGLEAALRRVRDLVSSAAESRLVRGLLQEIDSILEGA
jgi:hypothetical protein